MSYKVIPTDKFKKEAKRLIKKFPSLKQELLELGQVLSNEPDNGTKLGNNFYPDILTIYLTLKNVSFVS
jgi:hypothetical protein